MLNWVENPILVARQTAFAAVSIACLNTFWEITPKTFAQEFPLPTPTPKPLEDSFWDGMRRITRYGNYELATIKFCGGEQSNPENRRYVLAELQIDFVGEGEKPELEVWDHQTTSPTSARYPAKVETVLDRRTATLSKELPLGRYSFFVRVGTNAQRLLDQNIFDCKGLPVVEIESL